MDMHLCMLLAWKKTIFFSTHFWLYTPSTLFKMFRFIWCFLCQIFSPYGFVEDIYILRDEMRQNRGIFIFLIVDLSILYNFELHVIDWVGWRYLHCGGWLCLPQYGIFNLMMSCVLFDVTRTGDILICMLASYLRG